MNIIILGAPASGKGTQAEILARKFKLYYFQSGGLARDIAEKEPRIREMMNSGKLIPEEEMTMYVLDFLNRKKPKFKNILFEGYPRFINQYEALEKFLQYKGDDIDIVISLEIRKDVAIKRISSRRICEHCHQVYNIITNPPQIEDRCDKCSGKLFQRADDNPKSIAVRFEYYKENTKELISYLEKRGKLVSINGERPINEISKDLIKIVEKFKKHDRK